MSFPRDGGDRRDRYLRYDDGALFDNAAPEGARSLPIAVFDTEAERPCCPDAEKARLAEARFGPAFLMGSGLPHLVERLAEPDKEAGPPWGGRRALTFSENRQGAASLAAKLRQEAERGLMRALLYHSVQRDAGLDPLPQAELQKKLSTYLSLPKETQEAFAEDIRATRLLLGTETKPIAWEVLLSRFADHAELKHFAGDAWRSRWPRL